MPALGAATGRADAPDTPVGGTPAPYIAATVTISLGSTRKSGGNCLRCLRLVPPDDVCAALEEGPILPLGSVTGTPTPILAGGAAAARE